MSELDQRATALAGFLKERKALDKTFPALEVPVEQQEPGHTALSKALSQGKTRQRMALASALDAERDPDIEARVKRVGLQTGLPEQVIRVNLEGLEKRLEHGSINIDALMRSSPELMRWMLKNDPSPIRDDVANLSGLNWLFRAPIAAVKTGAAQAAVNLLEAGKLHKLPGFDTEMADEIKTQIDMWMINRYFGEEGWIQEGIIELSKQGAQFAGASIFGGLGAVGATILGSSGPQAAVPEELVTVPGATQAGVYTWSYLQGSGEIHRELSKLRDEDGNPLDPELITSMSIAGGATVGWLETLGLSRILKLWPGGKQIANRIGAKAISNKLMKDRGFRQAMTNFGRDYFKGVAVETGTEAGQQLVQIGARVLAQKIHDGEFRPEDRVTWTKALEETWDVSLATLKAMTVGGAFLSGPTVYTDLKAAHRAGETHSRIVAMTDSAKASKALERTPESYREIIQEMKKARGAVQNAYIAMPQWNEVTTGLDLDPAQTANDILGEGAYEAVLRDGGEGDLVIPIEAYLERVARTGLNDSLMPHVRFNENDISLAAKDAEDAQTAKDLDAVFDEVADEALELDADQEQIHRLEQQKLLEAMGDPVVADTLGKVAALMSTRRARRAGIGALEHYQQFPVSYVDMAHQAQREATGGDLETLRGKAVRRLLDGSRRVLGARDRQVAKTVRGLARRDPGAINQASVDMAAQVPDGTRLLVPVPNEEGSTAANMALAESVAKQVGARVADVLVGEPVTSSTVTRPGAARSDEEGAPVRILTEEERVRGPERRRAEEAREGVEGRAAARRGRARRRRGLDVGPGEAVRGALESPGAVAEVAGIPVAGKLPTGDFYVLEDSSAARSKFAERLNEAAASRAIGKAVTVKDPDSYAGALLVMNQDATAGVALQADNDIGSLFSFKGTQRDVGGFALFAAVLQHVNDVNPAAARRITADSYETILPHRYVPMGMRPVARVAWNEEFKPDGWDKEAFAQYSNGEPGVLLYTFDPERAPDDWSEERQREIPTFDEWDDAAALRDQTQAEIADRRQRLQVREAFGAVLLREEIRGEEEIERFRAAVFGEEATAERLVFEEELARTGVPLAERDDVVLIDGVRRTGSRLAAVQKLLPKARYLAYAQAEADLGQTTSLRRGRESIRRWGLDPETKPTVREVGVALENRQRELYGQIDREDRSAGTSQKIAKWMAAEIRFALEHPNDSGVGWYSEKFPRAIDALGGTFRELIDDGMFGDDAPAGLQILGNRQNARDFLTALVAITSNGNKVLTNWGQALKDYSEFRSTGTIARRVYPGKAGGAIAQSIRQLMSLLQEHGPQGLHEHLLETTTVSEYLKAMRALGKKVETEYPASMTIPRAGIIFGPKIGAFYANLMGAEGYLTMDLWWNRTFNRYRGTLVRSAPRKSIDNLKAVLGDTTMSDDALWIEAERLHLEAKRKGFKKLSKAQKGGSRIWQQENEKLQDIPFNPSDRAFMIETIQRAHRNLKRSGVDMTIADMQAILWYYEKRLYGELGARQSADISYEEVARTVVAGIRSDRHGKRAVPRRGTVVDEGPDGVEYEVVPGEDTGYLEQEAEEQASEQVDDVILGQAAVLGQPGRRGEIRFTPGGRSFDIRLFEGKDPSTVLHELAHAHLEITRQLATGEAPAPEILQDQRTIFDWLGMESWADLNVSRQETFAKGFEQYFREGQAPTEELQPVFARIKAWLLQVYGQIKDLVKLSPEVRSMFDRMLASEQQIDMAQREMGLQPIPGMAEDLSPEQRAEYVEARRRAREEATDRIRSRLMGDGREIEAWFGDESARIRSEVEEEFSRSPRMRALKFLQKGDLLGYETLPSSLLATPRPGDEAAVPLKLSKRIVLERYGPEVLKRFPRHEYIYAADSKRRNDRRAADPDDLAPALGFKTGSDLVDAMASFEGVGYNEQLDEAVQRRMDSEFGDLMKNPSRLAQEALDAVTGDAAIEQLVMEVRWLQRQVRRDAPANRQQPFEQSEFTAKAIEAVEMMPIHQLKPHTYRNNAKRHGTQAFNFATRGNLAKAFDHKIMQLWNLAMERQVRLAREQADAALRYFRRMLRGPAQSRLGKAGQSYQDQVNAMLSKFELRSESGRAVLRRESLQRWIADRMAEGDDVLIDHERLAGMSKQHYRQLQVGEMRAVTNAVKNIDKLATLKAGIKDGQRVRAYEQGIGELIGSAIDNVKTTGKWESDAGKRRRKSTVLSRLDALLLRPEEWISRLDGRDPNGPWARLVFQPFAEAQKLEADLQVKYTKKIADAFGQLSLERRRSLFHEDVYLQSANRSISREAALVVGLNWGNLSNRQKLMRGGIGWGELDEQQAEEILASLTREDWSLIRDTWATLEDLWPDIEAMERELTGVAPKRIDPMPFTREFADGTSIDLQGGYFPVVYDARSRSGRMQREAADTAQALFDQRYTRAMLPHGHTIERIESFSDTIETSIDAIPRHLNQAIHDLTHRQALLQANRILTDQRIVELLYDRMGKPVHDGMMSWLKYIANQSNQTDKTIEKFLRESRMNLTVVAMGLKATTSLQNFANFFNVLEPGVGVSPKYMMLGMRKFMTNFSQSVGLAHELSDEMKHRFVNLDRDLRDAAERGVGIKAGPISGTQRVRKFARDFALATIRGTDMAVAYPAWLAKFYEGTDGGMTEAEAAKSADAMIRQTLTAGAPKDLAAVQRGGELMKGFTMFYSWFGTVYMRMRAIGYDVRNSNWRADRDALGNMGFFLGRILAFWLMPAMFAEWLSGRGPGRDDDDETVTEWMRWTTIEYPFHSMPFVRDAAKQVFATIKGEPVFPTSFHAVSRVIDDSTKALAVIYDEGEHILFDEREFDPKRLGKATADLLGNTFGLPSGQFKITAGYVYDLWTGEEEPESTVELITNLLYRKPRRKENAR